MDRERPSQYHFLTYSKGRKTTTLQTFDVILHVSNVRDLMGMARESGLETHRQGVPVIEACDPIPSRAPEQFSLNPCFSSSNLLRVSLRLTPYTNANVERGQK